MSDHHGTGPDARVPATHDRFTLDVATADLPAVTRDGDGPWLVVREGPHTLAVSDHTSDSALVAVLAARSTRPRAGGGHRVELAIAADGRGVDVALVCQEGDDAPCRAPALSLWHDGSGQVQRREYVTCEAVESMGGGGAGLAYAGPGQRATDGPVDVVWDGQGWTWTYPEPAQEVTS